jgi:diguanylate cyclase (GGDEF)-like protein
LKEDNKHKRKRVSGGNTRLLLYKTKPESLPDISLLNTADIQEVDSLLDLYRTLSRGQTDLIVSHNECMDDSDLIKIAEQYLVPTALMTGSEVLRRKHAFILSGKISEKKLKKSMQHFEYLRQIHWLKKSLNWIQLFEKEVPYIQKELFVSSVKNYFSQNYDISEAHWITVNHIDSSLPPILNLIIELRKQKIDYAELVTDIEAYSEEVVAEPRWQLWTRSNQECLLMLWLPDSDGKCQCLCLSRLKISNFSKFAEHISCFFPIIQNRHSLCQQVTESQKLVYLDSLTDLYNQKYLNETLDKKIEEHKRYKTPFSILFIDIDHFKRVNDTMGHVVGSEILRQLGAKIKNLVRTTDYAFRYGGDEFIVLLSHTIGAPAGLVAERLREMVESTQFKVDDHEINITVSIGLAFFPEHANSAQEIIKIADEAMYYGKSKSRNIVYKAS